MPIVAAAVSAVASAAGSAALGLGASAGFAMGVANTVGFLLTSVVPTMAINLASRALAKKPGIPSVRSLGTEVNVRDPAAPREIVYGLRRKSGVFYPVGTSGTNNEYLHFLLLLAGHECQELGAVYFNDEEVPLDGSGNATGRYAGYVRIKKHLGTYNQTVDTDLQTDLGSGYWSNNHKLGGIAYLYVRLKVSPELFSGGIPEVFCDVKGRKVYDHRDGGQSSTTASTWTWSRNAALCRADYLRGVPTLNGAGTIVRTFGLGAADAEIDYDAVDTAANVCDETVSIAGSYTRSCDITSGNRHIGCANTANLIPGLLVAGTGIPSGSVIVSVDASGTFFTIDQDPTASGTGVSLLIGDTEDRYNLDGVVSSSIKPGDGLEAMKTADAGDILFIGGEWVLYSGEYRTPTVTLTESDLRAPLSGVRLKPSRREIYNRARGLYISPADNWQPSDIPPIVNATYKTQDGGEDLWADVELLFTTSASTAQRLNKILMERSRQGIAFTMRCKLTAFQVQAGDVVQVTNTRFGWTAKPFEVLGSGLTVEADANGNPYLGCDLVLKETASGVWDWSDSEETTVDLAPNTDLRSPFDVAAPTSLTVGNSPTMQADGTVVPRLTVSWTAPTDANVTNGGIIRIEYKLAASSDWLPWTTPRGDITAELIGAVVIGQDYNVRIRSENNLGVPSSWVTSGSTTATGDTTAPDAVAAPTVTALPGYNRIVTAASTADDFAEFRFYRNTSNTTVGATLLGESAGLVWNDPTATVGVTYWYFTYVVDRSENLSAASGLTSVTTALAPTGSTIPSDPTAATRVTPGSNDTYDSGDGTVFAFITLTIPAMPTNAVWQNVLYRRNGALDWMIAGQLQNIGSSTFRLDDLTPGVSYDVATLAFSASGASNTISATGSPFTAPVKSTAPAAPSNLTATAGTGKAVSLDWDDNTETDLEVYQLFRNTSNNSGTATKIAEVRVSRFVDADVTLAQVYYYWLKAENRSGVVSSFSTGANATPAVIGSGSVDTAAPSTPSAPTYVSETVSTAADGTTVARITIDVPALPSGAIALDALYRVSGATAWTIADQVTGAGNVSVGDLTPGLAYEFAVRGVSFSGAVSTVSSTLSRTAPTKSTGPATPTGGSLTADGVTPKYLPGTTVFVFGCNVGWTANTESDFAYYEVKATTTDTDGAVDYAWTPYDGVNQIAIPRTPNVILYNPNNNAGYVRVRAINRSGQASGWLRIGNANSFSSIGTGNLAAQNSSGVSVTSIKTGDGTSVREVIARYVDSAVPTLTGGTASETFSVILTNRGFGAKPDAGSAQCSSDGDLVAAYDFDDAGNSASNAVIRVNSLSGNITAGPARFSIELIEYN